MRPLPRKQLDSICLGALLAVGGDPALELGALFGREDRVDLAWPRPVPDSASYSWRSLIGRAFRAEKKGQAMNRTTRWIGVLLGVSILALAVPARAQMYSDWSAPVNLGPVVNTSASETCAAISVDGLTLYFARDGKEIWFTQRANLDAPWAIPEKLPATINLAGTNSFCPVLTADLHALYFVSDRPGGCGDTDMYVSYRRNTRDSFGWEEPVNLGCQVNSAQSDLRPSPFHGEDGAEYLYFSSARPGQGAAGTFDIYMSRRQSDGTFGPATLVEGLNTTANDTLPNVRERDGLEIFFTSNRTGGVGGGDLWTATRASISDPWSAPVNLGPLVNSSVTDQRPSLSWDGTTMYFQSTRPGGSGGSDLWVTTRTKLAGYVFASSANVAGLGGAFYKTNMTLLNPDSKDISISAGLMTPSGATAWKTITLGANSYRTYENFLQEAFGYTGGAGIALFTDASQHFVAVAEVYTESAAGRYSTPLAGLNGTDALAVSAGGATSIVAGLRASPETRANFGCSNLDPVPVTVRIDFSAMTGGAAMTARADLMMGPSQWWQQPVPLQGKDIFAFFTVTSGGGPRGVYCYGVNVDNASNDGTVIPAVRMP